MCIGPIKWNLPPELEGTSPPLFKCLENQRPKMIFVAKRQWMKQVLIGLHPVVSKYTRNRCMIGGCSIHYDTAPNSRGTCKLLTTPENNHKAKMTIFSFINKSIKRYLTNTRVTFEVNVPVATAIVKIVLTQSFFCVFLSPVEFNSSLVVMNVLWFELLIGNCYFIGFCSTVCACFTAKGADLVTWGSETPRPSVPSNCRVFSPCQMHIEWRLCACIVRLWLF